MQTLAGMDTGFGRTRGTGKEGEYYVCISYTEEDAGVYAAKASVEYRAMSEASVSKTID
jgi:cyanophycin synthetase